MTTTSKTKTTTTTTEGTTVELWPPEGAPTLRPPRLRGETQGVPNTFRTDAGETG